MNHPCVGSLTLLIISDCMAIEFQSNLSKPCIFPFEYDGKIYQGCSTANESEPWCPTEVYPNGTMNDNHYGVCDESCSIDRNEASKSIVNFLRGNILKGKYKCIEQVAETESGS